MSWLLPLAFQNSRALLRNFAKLASYLIRTTVPRVHEPLLYLIVLQKAHCTYACAHAHTYIHTVRAHSRTHLHACTHTYTCNFIFLVFCHLEGKGILGNVWACVWDSRATFWKWNNQHDDTSLAWWPLDRSAIPQLYCTVIHGNLDAKPCVKETSMSSVHYSEHWKSPSFLEIVASGPSLDHEQKWMVSAQKLIFQHHKILCQLPKDKIAMK